MKQQSFYRLAGIFVIVILWILLIPLLSQEEISEALSGADSGFTQEELEELELRDSLSGFDFVDLRWQIAFDYDTTQYTISAWPVQEWAMILLELASSTWTKIWDIGVLHTGRLNTSSRNAFWADEAWGSAMTMNLTGLCAEVPSGVKDCQELENDQGVFYATLDTFYTHWTDETLYPKQQWYLQNPYGEFPWVLFSTEEVGLEYSWLLQDIADSLVFFELPPRPTKTFYGKGIHFEYPSDGRPSIPWSDILVSPRDGDEDNPYRVLRVSYRWWSCQGLFNHLQTYQDFIEIYEPYHIVKARENWPLTTIDTYIWCIDTLSNSSIAINANVPIEGLISQLQLIEQ